MERPDGGSESSFSPEEAWEAMAAKHTGECTYGCPVCAGIGILKEISPDVASHLAAAGREFMLAAKVFLESITERDDGKEKSRVEKIPLD